MFEIQAHPQCGSARTRSAFRMLDSLIRCLSLTTLDATDPRTSFFLPGAVPVLGTIEPGPSPPPFGIDTLTGLAPDPTLPLPSPTYIPPDLTDFATGASAHVPLTAYPFNPPHAHAAAGGGAWPCGCSSYSLGQTWPRAQELAPAWANMPMWPGDAGEGEMQKEECRRVVWATVMLTVSHNTKTTAGTDREPQHLWIKDPANVSRVAVLRTFSVTPRPTLTAPRQYALLFPGETFAPPGLAPIPASKDSVWALYMRTLLMWHSCLRSRSDATLSDADRAQYAITAWLELDAVEAAMDRHTCDIQSGFMMQMREVLFK